MEKKQGVLQGNAASWLLVQACAEKLVQGGLTRLPPGQAASLEETTGSCPFRTSGTSRSSRGCEKERVLAFRRGSRQAEEVEEGNARQRRAPKQCQRVNANADECRH